MRHTGTRGRAGARGATAVALAGACLLSGCSSGDDGRDDETRQHYCSRLGTWQDMKARAEDAGIAGYAAVAAAKRIDKEGLDRAGSRVLDDTALAVDGDPDAEGRVARYCSDAGFETMVR